MTTVLKSAPSLADELDAAIAALAVFDAERLEAVERRMHTPAAERLQQTRAALPQIAERQVLLGQLLQATEANLRVLVSVLQLEPRREAR